MDCIRSPKAARLQGMIDSRWLYSLLLAAIGLAVAFLGMIHGAVFVGVPSQDATPDGARPFTEPSPAG
jgi:hypothetical protein